MQTGEGKKEKEGKEKKGKSMEEEAMRRRRRGGEMMCGLDPWKLLHNYSCSILQLFKGYSRVQHRVHIRWLREAS